MFVPLGFLETVAELILHAIRNSRQDDVTSPDGVEEFLDEVAIYDLEAKLTIVPTLVLHFTMSRLR